MDEHDFSTFGKKIHPGREVKISCRFNTRDILAEAPFQRFRIAYLKEGHGLFENDNRTQIITSPAVLCLNRYDRIRFNPSDDTLLDVMFFDPITFERYAENTDYDSWKDLLGLDSYFFRAFFKRDGNYIGTTPTSRVLGSRITQLIELTDKTLKDQSDDLWPCRSRSYFIELLLTVNSIYGEDEPGHNLFGGPVPDDIKTIIDWVHKRYCEKITVEDITKAFNTNKTTLNQRFKTAIGVTVIEYVINLRMQVASSLLRKTYLPVAEIMERAGYRDDAHFLRAFKKYAGCTPSEYRKRFETNSA